MRTTDTIILEAILTVDKEGRTRRAIFVLSIITLQKQKLEQLQNEKEKDTLN